MAIAITRAEPDAAGLRRAAARTKDADAARRMLALALVLDGRNRTDANPGADPKDHSRLAQPGEERDRAPGDGWRGQLAGMSGGLSALPVSAEIDRGRAPHRQSDDAVRLFAVADAAQVLAPGCLLGVAEQVGPGDVMMVAEFGPAQAGEVGLCAVRAGTVDAVSVLVIDALHGKAGMQRVPSRAFIGMDGRSFGNTLADAAQGCVFRGEHLRQRAAATLAHHHDGAALVRFVLGQPPVDPVGRQVLRSDMAAE